MMASLKGWPILLTLSLLAAACSGASARETASAPTPSPSTTPMAQETRSMTPPPAPPLETSPASNWGNLHLQEANVLAVAFEPLGEGRYRFDVTLIHDDDGEAPDFADWWQVEDLQGNLLGRRVLVHEHGTQPFTRSETIEIPAGIETVIVRGHDMRHGCGGQAMQVDLSTGGTIPLDEGSEP